MGRRAEMEIGRWCFVRRWGWAILVRQKPPHFWVLAATGWTAAHHGEWKLIKVAVEDILEIGPWVEPHTVPPDAHAP